MKKITFLIAFIALAFLGKAQELKKTYHPNGKVKAEAYYVNSVLHGTATTYHDNGNKSGEITFKKGITTGSTMEYYRSGKIKVMGYNLNDKMHGQWVLFHESTGNIESVGMMKYGKQTGVWYYYNADGSLKSTKKF